MNDLEELKSLLFGAEKQVLDSITERVQKPETRAVDIADVLPEAVHKSHQRGPELAAALREPVSQCIQTSLRAEPEAYADALYPIMGPAIRKSIANALRSFAQQINETVEHSLSFSGLRWRFEAWRAGVPFGDYIMQRNMLYRVEQAYLISRNNGLLVAHVHHEGSRIKDSDAVSAMFTAIQDFVQESFSPDRSGRLETADMGEFTLWAVHGPHALLVCVIRGVPPRALRGDLSAILERIHFRYADGLRDYTGDTSTVTGVDAELTECLGFEAVKSSAAEKRALSTPLIIALLLVIAALGYYAYTQWHTSRQLAALNSTFEATPGFFVAAIEYDSDGFLVRGLRDPLAPELATVASGAGLDAGSVRGELRAYQSLDPEIAAIRASLAVVEPPERTPLDELQAEVNAASREQFSFIRDAALAPDDAVRIRDYAATVSRFAAGAGALGAQLRIMIVGETDSSGSPAANLRVAVERAQVAARMLIDQGVDPGLINVSTAIVTNPTPDSGPGSRRVTIQLLLQSPDSANPIAAE